MLVAVGISEEYRGKLDQSTGGALKAAEFSGRSLSGDAKKGSL